MLHACLIRNKLLVGFTEFSVKGHISPPARVSDFAFGHLPEPHTQASMPRCPLAGASRLELEPWVKEDSSPPISGLRLG